MVYLENCEIEGIVARNNKSVISTLAKLLQGRSRVARVPRLNRFFTLARSGRELKYRVIVCSRR